MIAIKVLIRSVFMNGNILFPIIITVVFVLFVTIVLSRRIKKADYDERQLLARNTAYKVSFFFLLIYCFVCGLLHIFDFKWADTTIQMFLGIIISFSLFIALCIIKDAFFSNSSKQNNYSVIFFFSYSIVSVLYFLSGLGTGQTFWEEGEMSILVLYLVSTVCFLALGILSVIKIILEKRGARSK